MLMIPAFHLSANPTKSLVAERLHEHKGISGDIVVVQFREAKFETKSRPTCLNACGHRPVTLSVHDFVSEIEINF